MAEIFPQGYIGLREWVEREARARFSNSDIGDEQRWEILESAFQMFAARKAAWGVVIADDGRSRPAPESIWLSSSELRRKMLETGRASFKINWLETFEGRLAIWSAATLIPPAPTKAISELPTGESKRSRIVEILANTDPQEFQKKWESGEMKKLMDVRKVEEVKRQLAEPAKQGSEIEKIARQAANQAKAGRTISELPGSAPRLDKPEPSARSSTGDPTGKANQPTVPIAGLKAWCDKRARELNGAPPPSQEALLKEVGEAFPTHHIPRPLFREAIKGTPLHVTTRGKRRNS